MPSLFFYIINMIMSCTIIFKIQTKVFVNIYFRNKVVLHIERWMLRSIQFTGKKESFGFHTGLWLRTGCVTNAQVSFFGRTGF